MRFFIAFTISLLIYLFFLWIFFKQLPEMELPSKKLNNHVVKIDIVNMPLPKKVIKPIVKASPSSPVNSKPIPKKPLKKKVVKKKKIIKKKVSKKPLTKKPLIKKPKKKPIPKIVKPKVIEPEIETEVYIPVEEPYIEEMVYNEPFVPEEVMEEVVYEPYVKEEVQEVVTAPAPMSSVKDTSDDLASFFKTPDTFTSSPSASNYPNKKIAKLYGSDFHSFTPTQKEFIEDNLDTIQNITQQILTRRGYPEGAGINGQEGTNVVSFNLHPNGDISDLHLKTYIGSRPLDDNTLELIRTAYKDYPYPSTVTRIVFYVEYSIFGY